MQLNWLCGKHVEIDMSEEKNWEQIAEKIARSRGWIDYPTDSIECGAYWHTNRKMAPFGPRWDKEEFENYLRELHNQISRFPEILEEV